VLDGLARAVVEFMHGTLIVIGWEENCMATIPKVARERAFGGEATPDASDDRSLAHRLVDALPDSDLIEATQRLDELLAKHDPREQGLIARWIRPHPHRNGAADVVVAESDVPVYALIGDLATVAGDLDRVAADYEVPREAVEAALAYYRRHRDLIDARMYSGRPAAVSTL
jgi:uncharacterized protein (DUF433 family)